MKHRKNCLGNFVFATFAVAVIYSTIALLFDLSWDITRCLALSYLSGWIVGSVIYFYVTENPKDGVKMSFQHFVDTYCLNTSRWALPGELIDFNRDYGDSCLRYTFTIVHDSWMPDEVVVYPVRFSWRDWLKFNLWHMVQRKNARREEKAQEIAERKAQEASAMRTILTVMQLDIDKARKVIEAEAAKVKGDN